MFCVECGRKLNNDNKFCPQCGTAVAPENRVASISQLPKRPSVAQTPKRPSVAQTPKRTNTSLQTPKYTKNNIRSTPQKQSSKTSIRCNGCGASLSADSPLCGICGVANVDATPIPKYAAGCPEDSIYSVRRSPSYGKKRRSLFPRIALGVVILAVVVAIVHYNTSVSTEWLNPLPIYNMRNTVYDAISDELLGDAVNAALDDAMWSVDTIDDDSAYVYVEGYSEIYGHNIIICFLYTDVEEGYFTRQITSIEFPDSGEQYTDSSSIWSIIGHLF